MQVFRHLTGVISMYQFWSLYDPEDPKLTLIIQDQIATSTDTHDATLLMKDLYL